MVDAAAALDKNQCAPTGGLNRCGPVCKEPAMRNTQQAPHIEHTRHIETVSSGIIAGAAGGLAEIAWVTLYAGATGGNAAALARGVTSAAGVGALLPQSPIALGVAVHMTLAVALGVALAYAWRALRTRKVAATGPYPFMLAALAGVWATNFFVILPIVSPAFVYMVPCAVSLTSKLLFGLAAAVALQWRTASEPAPAMNLAGLHSDKHRSKAN
jgi:hypothetical protein